MLSGKREASKNTYEHVFDELRFIVIFDVKT